jgi:hypothetical protein
VAGDCGASLKSLAGALPAIFAAAVANADARITEIRREYASTRAQLATYIQAEFDWKGSSTDTASAVAYVTTDGELRAVYGWLFDEGGTLRFEQELDLVLAVEEWERFEFDVAALPAAP